MRLLLTGTDGYIGTIMGPVLIEDGHDVTGLDTGFYRDGWLFHGRRRKIPATIDKDLRDIDESDLVGFDAVVHLAELSNDPLGQLNPAITYRINHAGSVELARKCKAAGINRFIYASSCSVYGTGNDDFKTEESPVNPQTAYAECKVRVERDVSALADDKFSPTFLRNATAYGASPRMRFDIVLNNLAGFAWTTREIKMTSDGMPWRPLVHVLDICRAVKCSLAAERGVVHNQIFNVGDTEHNYRVKEIAEIVSEVFEGCSVTFGNSDGDNRSYRVSFDKINSQLPGFRCEWDALAGAQQLREIFERLDMPPETFTSRSYTRIKQLNYLIGTGQIDDDFFWRDK
jgi:nucleoside-diphosphate-sugar epimerase